MSHVSNDLFDANFVPQDKNSKTKGIRISLSRQMAYAFFKVENSRDPKAITNDMVKNAQFLWDGLCLNDEITIDERIKRFKTAYYASLGSALKSCRDQGITKLAHDNPSWAGTVTKLINYMLEQVGAIEILSADVITDTKYENLTREQVLKRLGAMREMVTGTTKGKITKALKAKDSKSLEDLVILLALADANKAS